MYYSGFIFNNFSVNTTVSSCDREFTFIVLPHLSIVTDTLRVTIILTQGQPY